MIVGLLGFIGSGKGTVAETLVHKHNFQQDSFASALKDACANIFDWPRDMLEGDTVESREWREQVDIWWEDKLQIPEFTPRLALQIIGTDVLRTHFHPDLWFLTIENKLRKNPSANIVISDVRFPNEIDMVKRMGGKLIQVVRGKEPVWAGIARKANWGDEDAQREMTECFPEAHKSEWAWLGCHLNHVIVNNGTISDLQEKINKII